jgi:hypothetical protein
LDDDGWLLLTAVDDGEKEGEIGGEEEMTL